MLCLVKLPLPTQHHQQLAIIVLSPRRLSTIVLASSYFRLAEFLLLTRHHQRLSVFVLDLVGLRR